ncbi:MAG: SDR family oxidoreductase [Kofleriaceae bacterium]
MNVFVTGATGFCGTAIVKELVRAGHAVTGLARSDNAADALKAMGAKSHRGALEDLESLRSGARAADGVIHAGFIHDFADFKRVCELDRTVVATLGSVLAGSDRPLIVTSGAALPSARKPALETDKPALTSAEMPRIATEEAVDALAGVKVSVVRLAIVHGPGDPHFLPLLVKLARDHGEAAYIGDGANRWPGVHVDDAAVLYRLALEHGRAGARYHAVGEEGVALREIAGLIGTKLGVPVTSKSHEQAAAYFGGFAHFAGMDGAASSAWTRAQLGWTPKGATLLADLASYV